MGTQMGTDAHPTTDCPPVDRAALHPVDNGELHEWNPSNADLDPNPCNRVRQMLQAAGLSNANIELLATKWLVKGQRQNIGEGVFCDKFHRPWRLWFSYLDSRPACEQNSATLTPAHLLLDFLGKIRTHRRDTRNRELGVKTAETLITAVNKLYQWTRPGQYIHLARTQAIKDFKASLAVQRKPNTKRQTWPAIERAIAKALQWPRGLEALARQEATDSDTKPHYTALRDHCIALLAALGGCRAGDLGRDSTTSAAAYKMQATPQRLATPRHQSHGTLRPQEWKQRKIAAAKGRAAPTRDVTIHVDQLPLQLAHIDPGTWLRPYAEWRTRVAPTEPLFHNADPRRPAGLTQQRVRNIRNRLIQEVTTGKPHQHAFRGMVLSTLQSRGADDNELLDYVGSESLQTMRKHYLRPIEPLLPAASERRNPAPPTGMGRIVRDIPRKWRLGNLLQQFMQNYSGTTHPAEWIVAEQLDNIWTQPASTLQELARTPTAWYRLIRRLLTPAQRDTHAWLQRSTLCIFALLDEPATHAPIIAETATWPDYPPAMGEGASHSL